MTPSQVPSCLPPTVAPDSGEPSGGPYETPKPHEQARWQRGPTLRTARAVCQVLGSWMTPVFQSVILGGWVESPVPKEHLAVKVNEPSQPSCPRSPHGSAPRPLDPVRGLRRHVDVFRAPGCQGQAQREARTHSLSLRLRRTQNAELVSGSLTQGRVSPVALQPASVWGSINAGRILPACLLEIKNTSASLLPRVFEKVMFN